MDTSPITDAFYPEITEDDIEVIEGDTGTSYRYVFPTRELSDSVSVDLEARWDLTDAGLDPSLEWNLTSSDADRSDYSFMVSLPKSFGETVDDIVFDPEPDEIIDPDPLVRWEIDLSHPLTISALAYSMSTSRNPETVVTLIRDGLNEIRVHSEVSACARWMQNSPMVAQCYLNVVAMSASSFGDKSCSALGDQLAGIATQAAGWAFTVACRSIVEMATTGVVTGCDQAANSGERETCQDMMWGFYSSECIFGTDLEVQICAYEAAAAVGDERRCSSLERVGNPEMANDCRAAITKDPSWCAKTEDPELRASCCENFRGTDAYDTCLAWIGEDATEEDTTTTVKEETTTTADEESTTTEPTEEDAPPAVPAGTYSGSFDEALLIDLLSYDFGKPETNTITITVDGEGSISGEIAVRQEGVFLGCPGAVDNWVGTIDAGQRIGPELPQGVSVTTQLSGFESFEAEGFGAGAAHCLVPPVPYNESNFLILDFRRIEDGVLVGDVDDYMPFELRLAP